MGRSIFQIVKATGKQKQLLDRFRDAIGPAIAENKDVPFADNDVTYAFKLQNERLRKKGIQTEYEVYERGGIEEFTMGRDWSDRHFHSTMCFKSCGVKRKFSKEGKKLYGDNRKYTLYETLTELVSGESPADEAHCCPSCGAVAKISELTNGCPYCGTVYKMDDLFPNISSYYFLEDAGRDSGELKRKIAMFMGIAAIGMFIILLLSSRNMDLHGFGLAAYLFFGSIIGGVVGGYFLWAIFTMYWYFFKAIASTGKVVGSIGSRSKFENRMKQISPEFSFEYFTSKAQSLIKTAIFAEDETQLLFYKGNPLDKSLKDIIDVNYGGVLSVISVEERENMVRVWVNGFFDNVYSNDSKTYFKHEVLRAALVRRTDIPLDYNFSMTRLQCPTCGTNYDATKNKLCPACNHEYDIVSKDWILTKLERT